mgnify:CR=1 FL=1
MRDRNELHDLLVKILGSESVYYQPPASVKINYPTIIYSKSDIQNVHADNKVFRQDISYEITVISKSPDCNAAEKISRLSKCRFNRHYVADNLYHDVFTLFL